MASEFNVTDVRLEHPWKALSSIFVTLLPMLTDVMKKRSNRKNLIAFILSCVFVLIYGYNRIHMTNHFLSDVCFGTLITYLIYSLISTAFLRTEVNLH